MEELKIRKKNIEMEKISVDNIYRYLLNFNKLYDEFNDDERREFLSSFIDEVLIYEDKQENGQLLRQIHFRTKMEPWRLCVCRSKFDVEHTLWVLVDDEIFNR